MIPPVPTNLINPNSVSEEVKYALAQTKISMILNYPFFACLMLDMLTIKVTKEVPTLGVDVRSIYVNPDFFLKLSLPERVFGFCHEIAHAMWMHMSRAKKYIDTGYNGQPFYPMVYNMAADYVINDMLYKNNIGSMIEGALHDRKYTSNMLVEDVYNDLIKDLKPKGGGGSGAPGDGTQGHDTHYYGVEPSTASHLEWERAIKSARDAAKVQGKDTAFVDEMIDTYFTPVVSWQDKIKAQVRKIVGVEEADWSRPNRRKIVSPGIYLPRRKAYALDHVVIAMDTSGSVSTDEARRFYTEAAALFSEFRPERLTIIYCDSEIKEVRDLFDPSELEAGTPQSFKGRGGTSFAPPFTYIEEQEFEPDVMIYMTDMEGYFPKQPNYPVIWLSTSTGHVAPFGTTIEVAPHDK